jgi:hypothetical protein
VITRPELHKHSCFTDFEVFNVILCFIRGLDSSVGIATRYGLDGQGIESRWRRDILHPSGPALDPPSLLYILYISALPLSLRGLL